MFVLAYPCILHMHFWRVCFSAVPFTWSLACSDDKNRLMHLSTVDWISTICAGEKDWDSATVFLLGQCPGGFSHQLVGMGTGKREGVTLYSLVSPALRSYHSSTNQRDGSDVWNGYIIAHTSMKLFFSLCLCWAPWNPWRPVARTALKRKKEHLKRTCRGRLHPQPSLCRIQERLRPATLSGASLPVTIQLASFSTGNKTLWQTWWISCRTLRERRPRGAAAQLLVSK